MNAKKITVGKNEAGMFEYQDSKKAIEMGDTAYVIQRENIATEETETLYFEKQENVR